MKRNPTPEQAAAAALVRLLDTAPRLGAITWTVGRTPGVLHGQLVADNSCGGIIEACAEILGGTPARSVVSRDGDRQGVTQLVATYEGVQVQVWASYPMPVLTSLACQQLRALLTRRRAVAARPLPHGEAR
ncbi:hypothetical protein [Streptomyces sp. NPDC059063]|uniref:hypothetical protein n=1 Tax=Streptomyces sp. NPDC059063 TaxID=3346712 RepID=UPI00367E418C